MLVQSGKLWRSCPHVRAVVAVQLQRMAGLASVFAVLADHCLKVKLAQSVVLSNYCCRLLVSEVVGSKSLLMTVLVMALADFFLTGHFVQTTSLPIVGPCIDCCCMIQLLVGEDWMETFHETCRQLRCFSGAAAVQRRFSTVQTGRAMAAWTLNERPSIGCGQIHQVECQSTLNVVSNATEHLHAS